MIILIQLFSGCAGEAEPVLLRVAIPYSDHVQDPETNYYINWLEEKTGFRIEPVTVSQTNGADYYPNIGRKASGDCGHILDQYASIMKTRYPGRFSFEAEEEDSLADIYIPRMLLQPLVENAILHGFECGMEMIRVYGRF